MRKLKTVIGMVLGILSVVPEHAEARESAGKNQIHSIHVNYVLYQICRNDLDGFSGQVAGGMYSYPSLRNDVRQAMITRASTGEAGFEFLSSAVPSDFKEDMVPFFFYSDVDLNKREPYDILINGTPLLSFAPDENGNLEILDNPGKGESMFYLFRRDQHGDGLGAFRFLVPVDMLEKVERARISVTGQAKVSTAWFMLFKVPHAIQWLREAALNDVSFSIRQSDGQLIMDAPSHLAGMEVRVVSDGVKSNPVTFTLQGEMAKASLRSEAPRRTFNHTSLHGLSVLIILPRLIGQARTLSPASFRFHLTMDTLALS